MTAPDAIATPRPAATLMVLRDGAHGIEVLMTERPQAASFAGGAMVFPGGKLDHGDHALADHAVRPQGWSAELLAHAIAAIRECFEECGLLFAAATQDGPLLDGAALAALDRTADFGALVRGGDLWLRPDHLVAFAHWITPPDRPRRFDTWFFAAAAPLGQAVATDRREVVRALWTTPLAALDTARESGRLLVPATYLNLWRLGESGSVTQALAPAGAIVTIMPQWHQTSDGGLEVRIPEGAGYSVTRLRLGEIRKS
jgi:8-oxo-dGTP pyrophosphatase MutT (NUDIX family)